MLTSLGPRAERPSAFAPPPGEVDVRDFSHVYRAYAARVSVWVRRLGGPDADIEDLTQEVFTVVLRRLGSFDADKGEIGAWLYGVTLKVVQGARRKRRVRQWLSKVFGPAASEAEQSHEPSAESQLVALEARQELYRLLDHLPEAQRTAFILYELEELDGPAIAALTNTTVANVWVRVHRARRSLIEAGKSDASSGGGESPSDLRRTTAAKKEQRP